MKQHFRETFAANMGGARRLFSVLAIAAGALHFSTSTILANEWQLTSVSDFGRIAEYQRPGLGLAVHCKEGTKSRDPSFIELLYGQDTAHGQFELKVDGRENLSVFFDDGLVVADTPESSAIFNQLIQMLRSGSRLEISDVSGNKSSLPLAGSSAAIGACPASTERLVEPPAASPVTAGNQTVAQSVDSELLSMQTKLQQLGYAITTPSGVLDAETKSAIGTFQRDNGFEVTGELSAAGRSLIDELHEVSFGSPSPTAGAPELERAASETVQTPDGFELTEATIDLIGATSSIRTAVIADAQAITEELRMTSDPVVYYDFARIDPLGNILRGSIGFVGCFQDDVVVHGYYSVGQDIWTVVWVDHEARSILDVKLSSGFSLETQPVDNAWHQLIATNQDIVQSMRQALVYQTEAFAVLFPPRDCPTSSEADFLFLSDQALASAVLHEQQLPSDADQLIATMAASARERHGIEQEQQLENVFLVQNVWDFTYFAAFTLVEDPTVVILQGWVGDRVEMELAVSNATRLVEVN